MYATFKTIVNHNTDINTKYYPKPKYKPNSNNDLPNKLIYGLNPRATHLDKYASALNACMSW